MHKRVEKKRASDYFSNKKKVLSARNAKKDAKESLQRLKNMKKYENMF